MLVIWSFCVQVAPGGVKLRPRRSQEVRGNPELQNGCLTESSGKGLGRFPLLLEAFSCQVWSFSVLLGRLQVASGAVKLRPRRSQEVRGSPKLQKSGLRPLNEASLTTFWFPRQKQSQQIDSARAFVCVQQTTKEDSRTDDRDYWSNVMVASAFSSRTLT